MTEKGARRDSHVTSVSGEQREGSIVQAGQNLIEEEKEGAADVEDEDGRAEVDSLLNTPLSDYPMSDIEEDK